MHFTTRLSKVLNAVERIKSFGYKKAVFKAVSNLNIAAIAGIDGANAVIHPIELLSDDERVYESGGGFVDIPWLLYLRRLTDTYGSHISSFTIYDGMFSVTGWRKLWQVYVFDEVTGCDCLDKPAPVGLTNPYMELFLPEITKMITTTKTPAYAIEIIGE